MSEAAAKYEAGPASASGTIPCGYCLTAFKPNKPWQLYCSPACRTEGNARRAAEGMRGRVAAVRRMKGGKISVTAHFDSAEAERVMRIEPGHSINILGEKT